MQDVTIYYIELLIRHLRYERLNKKTSYAKCVDRDISNLVLLWRDITEYDEDACIARLVDHYVAALRMIHFFLLAKDTETVALGIGHMLQAYGDCPSLVFMTLIEAKLTLEGKDGVVFNKKMKNDCLTMWKERVAVPQARGDPMTIETDAVVKGCWHAPEVPSVFGRLDLSFLLAKPKSGYVKFFGGATRTNQGT